MPPILYCESCRTELDKNDAYDYHGDIVCESCYNGHFARCCCCDDNYDHDYQTRWSSAWGDMCEDCSENHFECEACGALYHIDDLSPEDQLCHSCYDEQYGTIRPYHSGSPQGRNFLPSLNSPLYFGVELETDNYPGSRDEAGMELKELSDDGRLFWLEHDGSLNCGIEIISQPCTLDYHRDQFPWQKIVNIVAQHRGRSHDTGTCGLHIHFSRTFFRGKDNELYQLRLVYLVEKFYEELLIFSRRKRVDIENNAHKYDTTLTHCSSKQKIRELRERYGRYQAVNLDNMDTIEIRLFKGTLAIPTLLASIELVDFLVRFSKRESLRKLQTYTWLDLVKRINRRDYHFLPLAIKALRLDKKRSEEVKICV